MHGADPAHIASPEGMAEQMRKLQPEHLQRAMGALEDIGIGRSVGIVRRLHHQSEGCRSTHQHGPPIRCSTPL